MTTTLAWIALADYSLKYKVSISTLRRRIKNQDVEVRSEDGKYFLPDLPLNAPRRAAVPIAPPQPRTGPAAPSFPTVTTVTLPPPLQDRAEVQLLIAELKRAYAIIVQEKEVQILQLKEELTDLKTLVQVLEHENGRLAGVIKQTSSLDQWLKATDKDL